MRFLIKLAYKGTKYHGWQVQDNAPSVQLFIDHALSLILGSPIQTTGCGRTDTGVHASCFFAHFDTETTLPANIVFKINAILPHDIVVYAIYLVPPDFSARFDAVSRSYQYRIALSRNPFLTDTVYFFFQKLKIEEMNSAAALLYNYSDFGCFCKSNAGNHTNICQITEAEWNKAGELLVFHITANRFLRGMVRAIVGTLLEVGLGKMNQTEFEEILKSNNRQLAGRSVPPQGLFLSEVKYNIDLIEWKGENTPE